MKDFLLSIKKIKKLPKFFSKKRILLYGSPLVLFLLLFLIVFIDLNTQRYLQNNKVAEAPIELPDLSLYPILKSPLNPDITAQAAIVMDDDSKAVLFAQKPHLRFSMASTTKIMTALIGLSYYKLDDVLEVMTSNVEGSLLGLMEGEKMTFENLLYGMLLPSGNDAALTIADNYSGGETEFVKKMNDKAIELRLYNTHFSDTNGLDDYGDYTTVLDLARLASIALKNKEFSKIVSTKKIDIADITDEHTYSIKNLNKLLGISGVDGIKTGFTDEAQGVLVTSTIKNGHRLIIVVMKSEDRFADTKTLLDLISGNFTYLSIHP
ncbi:MAG: D-alanyl-D-alanine carboxypeptidase family protein [Candidatus Levybacteria bacterium]|nr:D-alanyl-D-alanine carboxypeptidase family protein [Candidatus Levybacteria bacterium]